MRIETSVACRPSSGFVPTVVTVPKVARIPPPRPAAIVIPTPPATPFARAAKPKPRPIVVDTPLSPPPAVLCTLSQPPKRRRSVVDAPPAHAAEVEAPSFSREHLRRKEHDRWTAAVRWLKEAHYADAQTKEKAASEAAKRQHLVDMAKTVREQNLKRFTKPTPVLPKQPRQSRTPTAVVSLPPKKPPVPRLGKRRSTKTVVPPSPVSNQKEVAPPPAPAIPKRKKRAVATKQPVDVASAVDETSKASLKARRATARVFMEQQKQDREKQRRRERQSEAEHARARYAKLQHVETVRLQRLHDSVALAKKTKHMETLVRAQMQSTTEHAMGSDTRPSAGRAFWPTDVVDDDESVDTEDGLDANAWPTSPPNNPPVDDTQSEAENDDENDDASNDSSDDDDGASTEPEDASALRKLYALKQLTDSLTNRLSQLSQPPVAPPPAIVPIKWQDTATAEMEERIEAALEMYAPQALPAPFKPPVYIPAEAPPRSVPSSVSSSASSLDASAFYRPTPMAQEAPDASDDLPTTETMQSRVPAANNQDTSEDDDDDSDGAPSWRRRPSLVDERPSSAWRVTPMLPRQQRVSKTHRLIAASRDAYSVVDMFAQELLQQQQNQQALRYPTPRFEAVEDTEDDDDDGHREQRPSCMVSPDDTFVRSSSDNSDGARVSEHDDWPAAFLDRAQVAGRPKEGQDKGASDEDAPDEGALDGMAQYAMDPDVEALLSEAHRILSREASTAETTPPRVYWDHMLLEDDDMAPALHRRPRVTIVTEEDVMAQRRQFSPRTLSRQLLAAVEFQETLHEAQMHLESLEHAHEVQETQDETLDWSHAVRADVDHLCESHALLQDTLAYQSQLHDENLLRQARDLLEERLQAQRDTAVQTEVPLRHDAGTEATWRQDAGTMAIEARDGGTQFALRLSVAVQSDALTVDAEAATPTQWVHVEPTAKDDVDYDKEEEDAPIARSAIIDADVESAVNESQVYSDAFEASVARPASVVDNSILEDDEDVDDDAAPEFDGGDGDEIADDDGAYSEGFESPRKSSMADSIIDDEDENDGAVANMAAAIVSDDVDDTIVEEDDAPIYSNDVNDATVDDDAVPIYSDGFESPGKPPMTLSTPDDEGEQVGEDDAYSEAFSSPRKPTSVADSVHGESVSGSPRHASVVGSVADDAYSEAFESPRKGSIATSVPDDDDDADVGSFEDPPPVQESSGSIDDEAHETTGALAPTAYTPLPSYTPSLTPLSASATPSPRVEAYLSSLAQRDATKAQYIRHILVRKASEDKLLELRYARLTSAGALSAWQVEMEKLHLDGARTANVAKCYEDMMCFPPESQDEVRVLAEAFGGSLATWTPVLAPSLSPSGPSRRVETTAGSTQGSNDYADEFEAASKDASNEVLEDNNDETVVEASVEDDDYNDDASVPDDDASVPDDDASVPDEEAPPDVYDEASTKDDTGLESGVVDDAVADVETAVRDDAVPDDVDEDEDGIDDDESAKEDAEIYSSDNFAAPSEDVADVSEAPVAEDDDPATPVNDTPDDVGVSGVYSDDDFEEHKSTVDEASLVYSVDGFEAPASATDVSVVDVPSASLPADPLVNDDAPVETSEPEDDIADIPSETSEAEAEVEDDYDDDAPVADAETTAQDDGEYSQDEFASGSAPVDSPAVAAGVEADADDGYGDDFESSSKSGSGEAASNTSEQLRRALDELQQTHPRLVSAEEDAKYTRRKLQALALLEAKKNAIIAGTKLSELAAIDNLVTYSLQLNVYEEITKQTPVFVSVAQDTATPSAAPATTVAAAPEPDDYSDSFSDDEEHTDVRGYVAETAAAPDGVITPAPVVPALASSLDEEEQRLQALQAAVAAKQQEAMTVQALVAKEERRILIHETIETLQVQLDQTERLVVSEADRLAALQATSKDVATVDNPQRAQIDDASDEVAGSHEADAMACDDASLDESFSSEKAAPCESASILVKERGAEVAHVDNDDATNDLLADDDDGSVELSVVDGESLSDVDVADASFGSQDDGNDDEPSIVVAPLALDAAPTIDVAPAPTVPRLATTPQVLDDSFSSIVDDEPPSVDLLDGFDVVEAALPANWLRETSVQTVATMETLDYIEAALPPVDASGDIGDVTMTSMDYLEDAEAPKLATAMSFLDACDHVEVAELVASASQSPTDVFASYDHVEMASSALPLSTNDVCSTERTLVADAEREDIDSQDGGGADSDALSDQHLLDDSVPLEGDIDVHYEVEAVEMPSTVREDLPSTQLDAYDYVEQAQVPSVSVKSERIEELLATPHVDIGALVTALWHNIEQDVWADVLCTATVETTYVNVEGELDSGDENVINTADDMATATSDRVDRLVDDIFSDVLHDTLLSLRRPVPQQTTVPRPSTPPMAPVFKADTLRDVTAFKAEYTLMTQARQAFDWQQIDAALVGGVDVDVDLPASTLAARRRLMQDWQRENAAPSARPPVDNVPKSVKELLLDDTSGAAVASVTSRLVKSTVDSEARILDAIWSQLLDEAVGGSLSQWPALENADT
ncbi:hypothetical protein SPRG_00303 [Saprolegnia parasitica CBS 223.65]|uniref:Uncharacterized protein n=1 Tax=Saprolegnia parasitica (strain CBS 223.65) TaxID=695850 RepID=A0A067D9Y0_SAPPC|nr:hypothetical protein SPRG_00303 [Saprolegnia parasitica CBS 223.65]KDO35456.1 hypothetical protein SPRG_00303 [Saprolegnia parasitica CBS 223.65]|eukprot:XP_012193795.1 hypothetical protein SPRG_00303 [Saprolegnia parasitica CBS 223.65]